jgi:hypothetical protein
MWLQAIADGERTVEQALREVEPVLSKHTKAAFIRSEFTQRAIAIKPRKKGRPPRGLPTAWHATNPRLVELVKQHEGLPAVNVGNYYNTVSVYDRVAQIWQDYGIPATPRQVQDSYYALTE